MKKKSKESKDKKDISSYFPKKPVVNPIQPNEGREIEKLGKQGKLDSYFEKKGNKKDFLEISKLENMDKSKQLLFVPSGENSEGVALQEKLLTDNPTKELNTTLSNVTALIDEIDRNTNIPSVKNLQLNRYH